MYADTITGSMRRAIDETNRRRKIQQKYNEEHGIVPKTIVKGIRDIIEIERGESSSKKQELKKAETKMTKSEIEKLIEELTKKMREASRRLEFEEAAFIRDKIGELRAELEKNSRLKKKK